MPADGQWIGWACAEGDKSYFEIVRRVAIPRRRWKLTKHWDCGEGRLALEPEMWLSCEPGSLIAIETMPEGAACMTTADVRADDHGIHFIHALAAVPRGGRRPSAILVRVRGIRAGHNAAWPRLTEQEAKSNQIFYGTATQISIDPATTTP